MNMLCPDLEKLLYRIERMDVDSKDNSRQDYEELFIEACKIRQSLRKLNIPSPEVTCLQVDCRAGVGLHAWRKFLMGLIPFALEKNYQLAQELLSNPILLKALNLDDEERKLIAGQPLVQPKNLRAVVSLDRVMLKWDRPSGPATGYQILRCCASKGEKQLQVYVANTGSTDNSYDDKDMTPGETYAYSVRIINETSLSKSSKTVKTTIPEA